MKTYRKVVISYVIILICGLLVFFAASKLSGSEGGGRLNYLSIEYFILTLGPLIMIIAASVMRDIINDLIPKEKR